MTIFLKFSTSFNYITIDIIKKKFVIFAIWIVSINEEKSLKTHGKSTHKSNAHCKLNTKYLIFLLFGWNTVVTLWLLLCENITNLCHVWKVFLLFSDIYVQNIAKRLLLKSWRRKKKCRTNDLRILREKKKDNIFCFVIVYIWMDL